MLHWPDIDPVALHLGPLAIHWYGLMYVLGFLLVYWLVKRQMIERGEWKTRIEPEYFEGLFTWLILGVVLGGRVAYILFYNFVWYAHHPLEVLYVWQGGMSFHGGMVGPIVAGWFFINGELWGRITDVPWGMVFPQAGPEPRHPSQLYELSLEGIMLFCLLWFTRGKDWPAGARVALFLTGYAVARIFCEQFRQPDAQLGFLFGPVTMGMLLSSLMLLAGVIWLFLLFRKRAAQLR